MRHLGLKVPALAVVEATLPMPPRGEQSHEAVLVVAERAVATSVLELELARLAELAPRGTRHDTVVAGVAVTILAPVARLTGNDRLLHAALGRGREYQADQLAVATVRYPPGLGGALDVMEGVRPLRRTRCSRSEMGVNAVAVGRSHGG